MTTIQAILFDCDGTLVDTETQTGQAIEEIMAEHGVKDASLPSFWTRGRTWREITVRLHEVYPEIGQVETLEEEIARRWDELVHEAPTIPGAIEALRAAQKKFRMGLVTGSTVRSVGPLFRHSGLDELLPRHTWVCADHYENCKPHPESYLLGAQRLGVAPENCVVFEDGVAGLMAAKAAGAQCIAVLETCVQPERCKELADLSIPNYTHLTPRFWRELARTTDVKELAIYVQSDAQRSAWASGWLSTRLALLSSFRRLRALFQKRKNPSVAVNSDTP